MGNPLNLQLERLTTRIVGAGPLPTQQDAARLAYKHGSKLVVNTEDHHTYVEFPDVRIDLQTIRHQTQIRTDLSQRNEEEGFATTAQLIGHACGASRHAHKGHCKERR